MASASVPSNSRFCKMYTKSAPFLHAPYFDHNSSSRMNLRCLNPSPPMHFSFSNVFSNCNGSGRTAVARGARDVGPPAPEEHGAVETVLKLYEAIKNKNVNGVSDIIAEECSCVSNFVSAFQPYLGKEQVMAFFSSLMKYLGNNIEIVVQQTSDDGMVVGVSWKLEWKQVPLHLGKGFSFYTCHVYHGKVMIRNVEMFLVPVLQMGPLRLKFMSLAMAAMDKLNPQFMFKNRAKKAIILFLILLFGAVLVYLFT